MKTYTRTIAISIEDIPKQLIEELKTLNGLPPHNTPSNICWNDGYFAKSIERRYDKDMIHAAYELVIRPLQKKISELS